MLSWKIPLFAWHEKPNVTQLKLNPECMTNIKDKDTSRSSYSFYQETFLLEQLNKLKTNVEVATHFFIGRYES